MPNANYAVSATISTTVGGSFYCFGIVDTGTAQTTSAVRIGALPAAGATRGDPTYVNVSVFSS
jgi:hypothetical protein